MKYLITGGTGTVGQALTRRLLAEGHLVTVFSRNEDAQIRMSKGLQSNYLNFIVGDVRDYQECLDASKVDIVYHLAAMKHVGICERQPQECMKTNVIGTMNMVNAAKANGVRYFVHLSTDKVVYPASVYGVSKLAAEKIVIGANGGKTVFSVIRSGNIWGSSNSIVPILVDQVKTGTITITDKRMTRFFITLPELVSWLIDDDTMREPSIFIPGMDSFCLGDLADAIAKKYEATEVIEKGIGKGEKMHERLCTEEEEYIADQTCSEYYTIPFEKYFDLI